MLAEVGLEERELELPTRVLSGGQRKLIGLAAAIIQDPQLLLLDEPEAHLDLEGRERLQGLMARFGGGILAVSHDRYLLDETVTDIASLDEGQVRMWPGNYTAYAVARELELKRQQASYFAQRKEIERLEEASRRLIQWARAVPGQPVEQGLDERRPQPRSAAWSGWTRSSGRCWSGGGSGSSCTRTSAAAGARPSCARVGMDFGEPPRAARRGADRDARGAGRRRGRERRRQERDAQDARRRAGADRGRGVGRSLHPDRLPGAGPGHPRPRFDTARHPARRASPARRSRPWRG